MEDVERRSFTGRAVILLGLWAGFWLIGLAVAAALFWVPLAQARFEGAPGLSGMVSGVLGLTVLWALRPRSLKRKGDKDHAGLPREQYPALFAFVEEIARRAGSKPPERVYLTSEVQAFASADRRWFGLRTKRAVGVGLPLLAILTREELGAVLAHEMGHHVGGDLALGPWVYRTRQAIGFALDSLHDSAFFLDVPFRAYGKVFLRASMAVSRERELAADALSASLCGAGAAGSALRKVEALGPVWSAYFELDAVPLIGRGIRLPLLEGFRKFRANPAWRPEVRRKIDEMNGREPSPWDSHPPLEERLRSIRCEVGATSQDGADGCLDLLGGPDAAEAAWYAMVTTGKLEPATWDDVAIRFVVPGMAKSFAGTSIDPQRLGLEKLPALVAEGARLWDRIRPPGVSILSTEAKRTRARQILEDWFVAALALAGFAPELRPGASLRMVRDAVVVEPASIVAQLAARELTPEGYGHMCAQWSPPTGS